jgi:hypothetical protein
MMVVLRSDSGGMNAIAAKTGKNDSVKQNKTDCLFVIGLGT